MIDIELFLISNIAKVKCESKACSNHMLRMLPVSLQCTPNNLNDSFSNGSTYTAHVC